MSAAFFQRYFNELSAYCLPAGASKNFARPDLMPEILRYEKIKWAELFDTDKKRFLELLLSNFRGAPSENDVFIERPLRVLLVVVNYLLRRSDQKLTWCELRELFDVSKLISTWEKEGDPVAKNLIYQLLNDMPGWPHSLETVHRQFGYMSITFQEPLAQMCLITKGRVVDLTRYLGGAMRLGGQSRLNFELGQMFVALNNFEILREPVLSMVSENYDKKVYWKALPAWAKGMVLEHDLGM